MNILFLRGFNNYTNRIITKYNTTSEYTERSKSYITFTGINFNPNDGIATELVVGSKDQIDSNKPLDWSDAGGPDYLVCFETANNTNTIKSRWFVIECQYTRLGQYKLSLKRDVIADNLSEIEQATCFIEKGIVQDDNDPAIYNKENITTNQIKSDEFLIKDETQCGWVVGYVAKDRDDGTGQLTPVTFTEQTIEGPEASDAFADETYATEEEFFTAHPELNGDLATLNSWIASVRLDIYYWRWFSRYDVGQIVSCAHNGNVSYWETGYAGKSGLYENDDGGWKGWFFDIRGRMANQLVAGWKTQAFKDVVMEQIAAKENLLFAPESQMQAFFNFVKREPVIKIGNKFYKPYDKFGGDGAKSTVNDSSYITIGSTLYDAFLGGIDRTIEELGGYMEYIAGNPRENTFKLEWSYNKHALGLREIFAECKAKIPANTPVLKDAPYHMFAIPFSDDLALYEGNTLKCVTKKSVAINAAQALAQQAGAGVVYDIQLLPYCPVRDIIKTDKVTAHAEIVTPTFDVYVGKTPAPFSHTFKYNVAKLNHKYVISKDLGADVRAVGIRSHIVDNTASPLKVKVGTDLENPTESYDAYEILVARSDLQDLTSSLVIKIYKTIQSAQQDTPEVVLDYATYVAGNEYICFEATDNCEYSSLVQLYPSSQYSIIFVYIPSGGASGSMIRGMPVWTSLVKDYIYYDDYYLSKIDITNSIHSNIVQVLEGVEGDPVNMIFWCTDSKFTFNKFLDNYFLLQSDGSYKQDVITDLINEKVKLASNVDDIKVRNQTDMIRLAAPNYSSFFDFNSQKNRGVEYINVDCTYKPYQPYMHLNPNFKGLYGADYNDVRGLICGGDYSIAITTDAWATYQLQNKNYQAVFDRQVQQLETAQAIQQQSDIANAVAGVGTGAIGGALVGAKVGGGVGAVAGAVVGGVTSAFGGIVDVYNNQRMRELQISTMKDIHDYQLANIKALPIGLAKTSYLTNNNKLFPFLEFYTCTATEDMAVRDMLDYNGMTINRIGKITNFQDDRALPYIKAKLIRIDTIEDAHHVQEIANELATGIYLPKPEPEPNPEPEEPSEPSEPEEEIQGE